MPNINITWQVSDQKLHKKIHAKPHKIYESRMKLTHSISISSEHVKISLISQKHIKNTHKIFLDFFCKKSGMHMGSDSNNAGAINNKNQRNTRKRQKTTGPYPHSPNPRIWWIRIKLTLQERWIDPDPSGSWSTLRIKGTWTGSWVDPTQRAYKKGKNPFSLISFILFSLSSPPFPFLANPSPNFFKSTQNSFIYGLKVSYDHSKYESREKKQH